MLERRDTVLNAPGCRSVFKRSFFTSASPRVAQVSGDLVGKSVCGRVRRQGHTRSALNPPSTIFRQRRAAEKLARVLAFFGKLSSRS